MRRRGAYSRVDGKKEGKKEKKFKQLEKVGLGGSGRAQFTMPVSSSA